MICATFGLWHDMVYGEVSEWEMFATPATKPFLLSVECVLVRPVVREFLTAFRYVVATDNFTEKADLVF